MMAERQGRAAVLRALGWCFGLLVVGLALWTLRGQWSEARVVATAVRVSWPPVLGSAALVIVAYLVLVATWRECVRDAGSTMPLAASARIWFVSNLARYIPGALWQMGALGVLARQQGVPASAATSAALVLTVLNTLCGLALVMVGGVVAIPSSSIPWLQVLGALVVLGALRWGAPPAVRWLAAVSGHEIRLPTLSRRMLAASIAGSTLAWLLYGVAFGLLVRASMPAVHLPWTTAVTVYTGAYLAGFLSLGPPAGIGVAEGAMVYLLTASGSADAGQAAVIAAITRIWRTVLEIVPGITLLLFDPARARAE